MKVIIFPDSVKKINSGIFQGDKPAKNN